MSERTCRPCDGTGCVSFGVECEHCAGTGNAPPGAVARPLGIDNQRRLAPTDAQLRTLQRLVVEGDRHDPAVHLASEALGRSDSDRVTINAHIAALTDRRASAPRVQPLRHHRPMRASRQRVPRRTSPGWRELAAVVLVLHYVVYVAWWFLPLRYAWRCWLRAWWTDTAWPAIRNRLAIPNP